MNEHANFGHQCPSVIARRYGSAACDHLPNHEGTHCQSSTGITWTDTQAAESWTGDDA